MYDNQGISQYPVHRQTRKIIKKGLIRGLEGEGHKERWLEDDPHSRSFCLRDAQFFQVSHCSISLPLPTSERECVLLFHSCILAVCVLVGSGADTFSLLLLVTDFWPQRSQICNSWNYHKILDFPLSVTIGITEPCPLEERQ